MYNINSLLLIKRSENQSMISRSIYTGLGVDRKQTLNDMFKRQFDAIAGK